MANEEEIKSAGTDAVESEEESPQEDPVAPASDFEVGYGKPPKHTRFKAGQSGNPRGRPKGGKNLKTDLLEELSETIEIREGGQMKKVTKQRAFVKALSNGSITGNARSAGLLLSTMLRVLDTGANDPEVEEDLSSGDLEILRAHEARLLKRLAANQNLDPTPASHSDTADEAHEEES